MSYHKLALCLSNIIQNFAFIPKIATSSKKAFCREWWERSSLFEHFNSHIFGSKHALQSHDVKNEINRVIYLVSIITSSLHIRNQKTIIGFYRTAVCSNVDLTKNIDDIECIISSWIVAVACHWGSCHSLSGTYIGATDGSALLEFLRKLICNNSSILIQKYL